MAVTPREPLYTPSLVFQRQPDFTPPNLLTLPASSVAVAPFVQCDFTPRLAFTFRQPEQFPNLVLSVVTAPSALLFPRDYTQARSFAYPQPEQYPNLALSIAAASALPPFIPYDFGASRRFAPPSPDAPINVTITLAPPVAQVVYHSDGDEKKRRRRARELDAARIQEYADAREALHASILDSFAIITGEERLPAAAEIAVLEKKAGQLPKAARPAFRRNILQIRNWDAELREIDAILLALDEQDFEDIVSLLYG